MNFLPWLSNHARTMINFFTFRENSTNSQCPKVGLHITTRLSGVSKLFNYHISSLQISQVPVKPLVEVLHHCSATMGFYQLASSELPNGCEGSCSFSHWKDQNNILKQHTKTKFKELWRDSVKKTLKKKRTVWLKSSPYAFTLTANVNLFPNCQDSCNSGSVTIGAPTKGFARASVLSMVGCTFCKSDFRL